MTPALLRYNVHELLFHLFILLGFLEIQSTPRPPNTEKKAVVLKTAVKGVIYNQEKHIRDLKISGGMEGEAVNGGVVGGGGRL